MNKTKITKQKAKQKLKTFLKKQHAHGNAFAQKKRFLNAAKKGTYLKKIKNKKVYNFEQSRNVGQYVPILLYCVPLDFNLTCNSNYK